MYTTNIPFKIDIAGADNKFVAYQAGCRFQIAAFEAGEDLHQKTADAAAKLLGRPFKRKEAKPINHGLNYRLGARAAASKWNCTEAKAKELIDGVYFRLNPEIRRVFHEDVRQGLVTRGSVLTNVFGRSRRFFPRISRDKKGQLEPDNATWNEGCNWLGQSPVAHVVNVWGILPIYELAKFRDVDLLNQIHDEIDGQIPLSLGWIKIAGLLRGIVAELEGTVQIKGRTCQVKAGVQVGTKRAPNWGPGMPEVAMTGNVVAVAQRLKNVWER